LRRTGRGSRSAWRRRRRWRGGSVATSGPIATSSGALSIGGDALYGQYWVGRIDELRIYDRALGATEIQTDMDTAVGVTCTDADGDGRCSVGSGADCDDANGQVWAVPGEVRDLQFAGAITLIWNAPASAGGGVWAHDVLRSSNPADFVGAGVCVESGDGSDETAAIGESPAPQQIHSYLVRARNGCPGGAGSLGRGSGGLERVGTTCP